MYLHCPSYNCKFFWIIHSFTWDTVALCQIIIIWGIRQVKQLSVFGWHSSKHTVEYVIISFIRHLKAKDHKVMYCGCHRYQFSKFPDQDKYKMLQTVAAYCLFLKHVMVKNPPQKEQSMTLSPHVPNMSHRHSSHKIDVKTSLLPQ